MGGDTSDDDARLLTRLNALKPSNISMKNAPRIAETDSAHGQEQEPDDLISRFQKLYGNKSTDNSAKIEETELASPSSGPPSPTIEELLAELEQGEECKLDPGAETEARELMSQAQGLMSREESKDEQLGMPAKTPAASAPQSDKDTEEADAQETLQRILDDEADSDADESDLKDTRDTRVPATAATEPASHSPRFPVTFPAAPINSFSALQFPVTPDEDPDGDTLRLPSAPKTNPATINPAAKNKAGKPNAQSSAYSDEQIESWCVICCANASVQCFGCGKDLYCWGCWREGHMGEGAGLDERNHVWERVKRRN